MKVPSNISTKSLTITPTVCTPNAITILAGAQPTCQLTNGTTTTTYSTTATNNTGFNWSLSNGSAGTISATGVMTWANGFSGTVDIRVSANGCNGPSVQVVRTVIISLTPAVGTLSPALYTGCTGTASGTITLGTITGSVREWQSSTNGGVTWAPITNTLSSLTYNNLSQTTI